MVEKFHMRRYIGLLAIYEEFEVSFRYRNSNVLKIKSKNMKLFRTLYYK